MPTRREEELEAKVAELQKQVDDLKKPGLGRPMYYGQAWREYKSAATWMGLPLVHICSGINPETGRRGVAKGVIAIGDIALGILALGGMAVGVLALGGVAFGLLSVGGVAIGIGLAIGGSAIGGIALGGAAIGGLAIGGAAVGYIALGGAASGVYALGGEAESARAFTQVFTDPAVPGFIKSLLHSLVQQMGIQP